MFLSSWLRNLARTPQRQRRPAASRFRPHLVALENRTLPSVHLIEQDQANTGPMPGTVGHAPALREWNQSQVRVLGLRTHTRLRMLFFGTRVHGLAPRRAR